MDRTFIYVHNVALIEALMKHIGKDLDWDSSLAPLSSTGLGFKGITDYKSEELWREVKKYMITELGMQFTSKNFDINLQAARNGFENLGKKGSWHNAKDIFSLALFNSNVKWIGVDILEKIPVIKQYTDLSREETKDISLMKAFENMLTNTTAFIIVNPVYFLIPKLINMKLEGRTRRHFKNVETIRTSLWDYISKNKEVNFLNNPPKGELD